MKILQTASVLINEPMGPQALIPSEKEFSAPLLVLYLI